MDTFKKDRKDVRNAIKNSMEFQNVKPIMANIFMLLNSKIDVAKEQNVEAIESMIYNSETWVKLDSEIRRLEEKIRQISDVDKVFNDYIVYSSYFSKFLFLLVIVVAAVIPVFLFGELLALTVWLIALTEVSIGLLVIKWKAARACSKFENYEDIYVNK